MDSRRQIQRHVVRRRSRRALLALAMAATVVLAIAILPRSQARWIRTLYAAALGAELLPDDGVVLQQGRADCGPAALAHVLRTFGSVAGPGRVYPTQRDARWGVSADTLADMSRRAGLPAEVRAVGAGAIDQIPLPAIALLGTHFVVLERRDGPDMWRVFDPSLGRLRMPRRSLANDWRGVVIAFRTAGARSRDRSEPRRTAMDNTRPTEGGVVWFEG